MIYVFTFLLGFCSIVYELLLGQSLSAFLGNTVLRYSVTIGLYMLSMGIGALMAEGRWVKHAATTLLKVEILLTVVGGFSVIFLLILNSVGMPDLLFSAFAHLLIQLALRSSAQTGTGSVPDHHPRSAPPSEWCGCRR